VVIFRSAKLFPANGCPLRNVFEMTSSENDRHDHFLRLYVEHEAALNGFVRTLVPLREDAREVMQEVAVVLWRRFEELSDPRDFRRWAFGVAKFKALAFARDRMRDRLVFDADVMELLAAEITDEAGAYETERMALDECLGKLDPAQRKLLEAAYAPGVRMDDLAASMGRSPMSFYKAVHRIRLALMDCTQRVLRREALA
jgi:RNA polymerase sigma-70 factor (ECF subfamily)